MEGEGLRGLLLPVLPWLLLAAILASKLSIHDVDEDRGAVRLLDMDEDVPASRLFLAIRSSKLSDDGDDDALILDFLSASLLLAAILSSKESILVIDDERRDDGLLRLGAEVVLWLNFLFNRSSYDMLGEESRDADLFPSFVLAAIRASYESRLFIEDDNEVLGAEELLPSLSFLFNRSSYDVPLGDKPRDADCLLFSRLFAAILSSKLSRRLEDGVDDNDGRGAEELRVLSLSFLSRRSSYETRGDESRDLEALPSLLFAAILSSKLLRRLDDGDDLEEVKASGRDLLLDSSLLLRAIFSSKVSRRRDEDESDEPLPLLSLLLNRCS